MKTVNKNGKTNKKKNTKKEIQKTRTLGQLTEMPLRMRRRVDPRAPVVEHADDTRIFSPKGVPIARVSRFF